MTQQQMFWKAHRQLHDKLILFNEMRLHPTHPLTVAEMETLITKRPGVYGFMQPTIDRLKAEGKTH